jgi:2-amino-4-hydroxy-6-hydroxymethyldihydropteridine diphosphokinase
MDVYISLGSNLQQPLQQINRGLAALAGLPNSQSLKTSALYQSKAMRHPANPRPQPDYINAVAWLKTELAPCDLLAQLQQLERQQGRQRGLPWSARTLDLDILLYGELVLNDPVLTLPHPRLLQRDFVLYPLYDCNPALILPHGQALVECLEQHKNSKIQRLT